MVTILLLAAAITAPRAQSARFGARLSPVPLTAATAATITGTGSASAVVDGATLVVSGSFSGMQSPATSARLHMGERTGVRGPAIFDLEISNAPSGSISATLQVSRLHVTALERGQFYVQIHSQTAPEGNLWGWLLADRAGE